MKRESVPRRLRFAVLDRDGFTCQYCGAKAPDVKLHVDHVIAASKGGETCFDNLITSCEACNSGKSNSHLSSAPSRAQALAEESFDRAQLVRESIDAWSDPMGAYGAPKDAPEDVLGAVQSEGHALEISLSAARLSQSGIADVLKISEAYISRMKGGYRPIPEKLVDPICIATGTNLLRQFRDLQCAMEEVTARREVERLADMLRQAA